MPPLDSNSASDASLRRDYVLSQDAYGSSVQFSLRSSTIPGAGARGRPAGRNRRRHRRADRRLCGLQRNGRSPSSLVTGYDFLADAADAVTAGTRSGHRPRAGHSDHAEERFAAGSGVVVRLPAGPATIGRISRASCSAAATTCDLPRRPLQRQHALAADFTTNLITTDLAASTHGFQELDRVQRGMPLGLQHRRRATFCQASRCRWTGRRRSPQKQATLIAGTGYQYGDTDFIEYSERLYLNFAKQLRAAAPEPVAVGEALVKAKLQYLATTPDIRGIHQKALLEATLFGLPMLGVNMPCRAERPSTRSRPRSLRSRSRPERAARRWA